MVIEGNGSTMPMDTSMTVLEEVLQSSSPVNLGTTEGVPDLGTTTAQTSSASLPEAHPTYTEESTPGTS